MRGEKMQIEKMQIEEHISGEVQTYDFEEETWVTRYTLDDSNVIDASTRRQCCADGAFEIGTAYAATMQLVCRLPGATRFQIRGAKIVLRSQYGTEESPEPIGTFWVTDAQKIGDIFTLSGQCAVGWTDTSSYNELSADAAESMAHLIAPDGAAAPLQELLGHRTSSTECVTDFVNMFVRVQTGIPDMIRWEDFDTVVNGDYCNRWIYEQYIDPADGQTKWRKTAYPAQFSVWNGNGVSATDCPRDYYRWMSQLAGGFITSKRNGALTLRQYAMPELGTAVITTADIEENGCEVADYTLQIYRVSVTPDLETEYWVSGMSVFTDPLYASRVPIRIAVESNPVLDGFCKRWSIDEGSVPSVWTIAHNLWWAFYYHYGDIPIRPFRAVTHKQARFELGQRISIHYRDIGETQETTYGSVITSVEWRFRGGHVLACAGEDSRVMADCLRSTKADKAVRELRGRIGAIRTVTERTQAEYDAMPIHDPKKLYAIPEEEN